MPKIALIIEDAGANRTQVLSSIRRHTKLALGEISAAIESKRPLIEKPLFDRADPDLPQRLLQLMSELSNLGAIFKAYELLDHQRYNEAASSSFYEVTPARLKTMIESRVASLEQQRKLAWLEDAEPDQA